MGLTPGEKEVQVDPLRKPAQPPAVPAKDPMPASPPEREPVPAGK